MTYNEIIHEITNPGPKKKAISVHPNNLRQREIAFSIIEKLKSSGFHLTIHLFNILKSTEPFIFYAATPDTLYGWTIQEYMDLEFLSDDLRDIIEIDSDNAIPFVSLLT